MKDIPGQTVLPGVEADDLKPLPPQRARPGELRTLTDLEGKVFDVVREAGKPMMFDAVFDAARKRVGWGKVVLTRAVLHGVLSSLIFKGGIVQRSGLYSLPD